MESLASLFGGGTSAGASPSGGLGYLGAGQVNPPDPARAASNPNYGPAQQFGGTGDFFKNLVTQLQQKSAVGGGGGMPAANAADPNAAAAANAHNTTSGIMKAAGAF